MTTSAATCRASGSCRRPDAGERHQRSPADRRPARRSRLSRRRSRQLARQVALQRVERPQRRERCRPARAPRPGTRAPTPGRAGGACRGRRAPRRRAALAHQCGGRAGDHELTAVGDGHEPGRRFKGARTGRRLAPALAGVDADARTQLPERTPVLLTQAPLDPDGGGEGVRGRVERAATPSPPYEKRRPRTSDHRPRRISSWRSSAAAMARRCSPQPGRTLDVGEQKGDRPGRKRRRHRPTRYARAVLDTSVEHGSNDPPVFRDIRRRCRPRSVSNRRTRT